ncbi:EutP/PduV family microcompartment system protein [Deinococcus sp. 6YEL10]|nr:EutP/PduV family microcompartment system protein [Deinococcus sp. 6YEL10]
MRRIIVIGTTGSGKTTFARALAAFTAADGWVMDGN